MNRDATYRYYNCNIQAPKLKCNELNTTALTTISMNGMSSEGGFLGYANSFFISPLALQQPTVSGELTCYVTNEGTGSAGVLMMGVYKTKGTLNVVLYQNIGSYGASGGASAGASNATTLRVTLPTGMYGTCSWSYKGI